MPDVLVAIIPSSGGEPFQEGTHGVYLVALLKRTTHPLVNPTSALKPGSDSDDCCTGTIEQLITIMISEFPSDAPEQSYPLKILP